MKSKFKDAKEGQWVILDKHGFNHETVAYEIFKIDKVGACERETILSPTKKQIVEETKVVVYAKSAIGCGSFEEEYWDSDKEVVDEAWGYSFIKIVDTAEEADKYILDKRKMNEITCYIVFALCLCLIAFTFFKCYTEGM